MEPFLVPDPVADHVEAGLERAIEHQRGLDLDFELQLAFQEGASQTRQIMPSRAHPNGC